MSAILSAHGITKRFAGLTAVDDVTVNFPSDRVCALIGPNGAGKTTLFNIVTGFEKPDRGRIKCDGRDLNRMAPWQISRAGIVRTFQTPGGFPKLTVWENMMVAGSTSGAEGLLAGLLGPRIWRSKERTVSARAEAVMADLDLGALSTALVENLSAGELKRVEFGRALMTQPRFLLLDEPAAGVHAGEVQRIAGLIRSISERGIGVVVVDHNLSFVMSVADAIYVLARGKVIAEGDPRAVSADPVVIETYLGQAAYAPMVDRETYT